MTKVRRPYSRVYWEALDDPKFATVWDDDRALAAWLRLLVAADMAWPASASLYHGVNRAALTKLCDVGLVDMQTAGRYRIHGLDKERAARARQASDAAAARWDDDEPPHPAGNADGMRPHPVSNPRRMPSQDEQSNSRDEQSKDEHSTGRATGPDEPYRTLEELTNHFPVQRVEPNAIRTLDALCDRRGIPAVLAALRAEAPGIDPQPPAPWPLIAAARNRLEPFASTKPAAAPKGMVQPIEEIRRALDAG